MIEDGVEDDEEYAAYVGVEDEDDPYNEPAHWYEDEHDAVEPESAYPYWEEEDGELQNFTAYISDECAMKYTAETAFDAAELGCVACLHDTLGADCCKDPDTCADFIQTGATAFVATKKGKGKSKGKGKGKYPIHPSERNSKS